MFPAPSGAALMPSGEQSSPVLGQGMAAALLLLPQLPHISEKAEAAVSSVVQPWAALCKANICSLMAWSLHWISGKRVSEAELLRKH